MSFYFHIIAKKMTFNYLYRIQKWKLMYFTRFLSLTVIVFTLTSCMLFNNAKQANNKSIENEAMTYLTWLKNTILYNTTTNKIIMNSTEQLQQYSQMIKNINKAKTGSYIYYTLGQQPFCNNKSNLSECNKLKKKLSSLQEIDNGLYKKASNHLLKSGLTITPIGLIPKDSSEKETKLRVRIDLAFVGLYAHDTSVGIFGNKTEKDYLQHYTTYTTLTIDNPAYLYTQKINTWKHAVESLPTYSNP